MHKIFLLRDVPKIIFKIREKNKEVYQKLLYALCKDMKLQEKVTKHFNILKRRVK